MTWHGYVSQGMFQKDRKNICHKQKRHIFGKFSVIWRWPPSSVPWQHANFTSFKRQNFKISSKRSLRVGSSCKKCLKKALYPVNSSYLGGTVTWFRNFYIYICHYLLWNNRSIKLDFNIGNQNCLLALPQKASKKAFGQWIWLLKLKFSHLLRRRED